MHRRCYYISVTPLRLSIDSLHSISTKHESCTMLSHIASAIIGHLTFRAIPAHQTESKKMEDAFLYLASAISCKFLTSVPLRGYNSHSSKINNAGFLYCWITFLQLPLLRLIASSVKSSGSLTYLTDKNFLLLPYLTHRRQLSPR